MNRTKLPKAICLSSLLMAKSLKQSHVYIDDRHEAPLKFYSTRFVAIENLIKLNENVSIAL